MSEPVADQACESADGGRGQLVDCFFEVVAASGP